MPIHLTSLKPTRPCGVYSCILGMCRTNRSDARRCSSIQCRYHVMPIHHRRNGVSNAPVTSKRGPRACVYKILTTEMAQLGPWDRNAPRTAMVDRLVQGACVTRIRFCSRAGFGLLRPRLTKQRRHSRRCDSTFAQRRYFGPRTLALQPASQNHIAPLPKTGHCIPGRLTLSAFTERLNLRRKQLFSSSLLLSGPVQKVMVDGCVRLRLLTAWAWLTWQPARLTPAQANQGNGHGHGKKPLSKTGQISSRRAHDPWKASRDVPFCGGTVRRTEVRQLASPAQTTAIEVAIMYLPVPQTPSLVPRCIALGSTTSRTGALESWR
jgi:hypothetical protein